MPPTNDENNDYSDNNILKLTPREHIRRRPGMYIGGTDQKALHGMLWQAVNEGVELIVNGDSLCNMVTITLLSDLTVRVENNGAGLPVDQHPSGKPYLEVYVTEMSPASPDLLYDVYGIGAMGINALSSHFTIESKRDGFLWQQTYKEGLPTSKVLKVRPLEQGEATGTAITFTPDSTIMDDNVRFDFHQIMARCEELAYLLPQATFIVIRGESIIVYDKTQGLADWVKAQNNRHHTLHDVLVTSHEADAIKLELALQFTTDETSTIRSYANTLHTPDGGTHENALIDALLKAIFIDSDDKTRDDLHGLTAIIHVYHPDPHFESQVKIRLLNEDVQPLITTMIEQLVAENRAIFADVQDTFLYT